MRLLYTVHSVRSAAVLLDSNHPTYLPKMPNEEATGCNSWSSVYKECAA